MPVSPKPNDGIAFAPPPSPDIVSNAEVQEVAPATATGFVVAPGRTVDGKQHPDTVELDETDAKRFVELGFVLDRNGERHVSEGGPAVNVEDGVQVREA